jgi:hypothetical protein
MLLELREAVSDARYSFGSLFLGKASPHYYSRWIDKFVVEWFSGIKSLRCLVSETKIIKNQ